jgi:hypothetical protein
MYTTTFQSISTSTGKSSIDSSEQSITDNNTLNQTQDLCNSSTSGNSRFLFDGFPVMEPLKMALESDDSCDKSSCSEYSLDHEHCDDMDCDYFHKSCAQTFHSGKTQIQKPSLLEASNENILPRLHHALQTTEPLSGLIPSNESSQNPPILGEKEQYLSQRNHSSNPRSPKKKVKVEQKQKKRVSVNKVVIVVPIPSRAEYCSETRQRIWSSAAELYANAARNTVEFASEGWNWRNVLEEDQMLVHQNNGEFIHPIHLQNVLACMSHASEHADEQRQLIESLVPSSSLFPPKDTDMVVATSTSSSNVNIVATSSTTNAVSAQRGKECRAA